jgi:L-asparaginase II
LSFVKMVEVWRGPLVESVHAGVAAVANAKGEVIAGWGDVGTLAYPRSALKPVQAIALVESGALDAFGLTARHLAFACASHRGEPHHSELALSWLAGLGVGEEALACGPDRPWDQAAADRAVSAGRPRRRIYHNCSGKHCGLLTVARHRGWPLEAYQRIDHPVQQAYLDALSGLLARDARSLPLGVDGCTLPAAAMPVGQFAVVMARFAAAQADSAPRRSAMRAIHEAMRLHPEYVSGSGQPGVRLTEVTRGRLVMKTGAEGFIAVFAPRQGLGVALKIADGEARARVPALIALLSQTGLLDERERRGLAALAVPPILDSSGAEVGRIRACGFGGARSVAPAPP